MAKFDLNLAAVMANPRLSLTSSPFAPGKVIIKRASFIKGIVPAHLRSFLISPGTGRGMTGTGIYKGKPVPKTAINIARTKGRRPVAA
jgi:hypothetical protein